ncbi:MAG: PDZ domain-containing protein [Gammaproteobacteria bacterium]|nr:PDZ domain-containing protein [Gammaproteobacteria bacterium]
MRWLEHVVVSALAASFGALLTLLWVGDADNTRSEVEPQPVDVTSSVPPDLTRLADQIAAQAEALARLHADNAELTLRLRELERLEFGEAEPLAEAELAAQVSADAAGAEAAEPEELPELPPVQRLVRAGIEPAVADAIQQRVSALEMERLYLRDQATREGWRDSDRFAEAMRELAQPAEALRREFGDQVYDQYLYAMGQGNRVLVASTLQDSPAAAAGIRAGDTVLSYAGERVYSISDLQSATVAGEPGASVVVELVRDGVRWYATVPRGPLGVRLDITRRAPGAG